MRNASYFPLAVESLSFLRMFFLGEGLLSKVLTDIWLRAIEMD